MPDQLQVFTIGHSSHPLGTFIWLLRKHGVQALVDIRRYPGSKRHPQFSRENLSSSLDEEDIDYLWLEALGGRRKKTQEPSPNQGLRNQSFRNYADYMGTEEFRQGVAKLMKIAGRHRTTIMCAESMFWQCHRRLLSDYLTANGVNVQHIMPAGEVKPHEMTPGAKIVDGTVTYPGPPTLFDLDAP
ncbi:MAG: DUF488 domain-containing protein [Thermoguttaceae bacterium]|jgi:uncharacterized protein (DUF488 family)|nr:DUF488 domain-containing protein [Thermoguttaceae bacterium]